MNIEWVGYTGVVALALAWIPQTRQTISMGKCEVALGFLLLGSLGSGSLMIYAMLRGDTVFSILNGITTLGGLVNLFYKFFPRVIT